MVVWMLDCGGVLKLQSIIHNERNYGAGHHTWWHKCRVCFLLGLSPITVLADVNALLGMPGITMQCSCSCYAIFLFTSDYLYTSSHHAEVQINNLLLDPKP